MAVDPEAKSESPNLPAFLAPPPGAPAYYGFPILEDVSVDGFVLGKITDFEGEPCDEGDSFVVAPDGSRAGLAWEVGDSFRTYEVLPFGPTRWGVLGVPFVHPMNSRENARRNLQMLVPFLRQQWEAWAGSMKKSKMPG